MDAIIPTEKSCFTQKYTWERVSISEEMIPQQFVVMRARNFSKTEKDELSDCYFVSQKISLMEYHDEDKT
jgi:hypothetical protein